MRLTPTVAQGVPLHKGQVVRVKFGHKWWDAEMTEDWEPLTKRGMKSTAISLWDTIFTVNLFF